MQRYSEYKDSGVQWLGEIPSHWEVKRLASFFSERRVKVSDKDYPPLSVTKLGIFPQWENVAKTNDGDNRKLVRKGDFVINSRSDRKGSSGVSDKDGSVSLINIVLKPRKVIHVGYSNYLLKSYKFIEEYYRNGRGIVADLWTTRFDEMKMIKLAIPTLIEQEAISNYLDSVTSKIDTAIAQQQKMIDLLNERKQIIINNAVTKGLNPNVKMKDSGVEWIGEIPEHWEVIRIKHLLRESKIRSMRGKEEPLSMSQSYGLIPTKNMETIPNMASSYAGAKIVRKGNLVFNKLKAHLGVFNVSKYDGLVSPDYAVYSSLGKVNLRFLEYLFKTPKCIHEFVKLITGVGAGLSRLYTSDLFSIYCAIPSLEEQNSICSYIQNRTLKIDESIMLYRKQISLLQERKQIIINDVVTGKVKVV